MLLLHGVDGRLHLSQGFLLSNQEYKKVHGSRMTQSLIGIKLKEGVQFYFEIQK